MLELAWRLWHEEREAIHYHELVTFVEGLAAGKVVEFGDEEVEDVAREMQAATFSKRDDAGNFSFVHRSFMEYFLARKLLESLMPAPTASVARLSQADGTPDLTSLDTRRFDRKIVYFLTLLDKSEYLYAPLQQILTSGYTSNVSENALQILYWASRIRCGMEEQIDNLDTLRMPWRNAFLILPS
jgi:hypothetical protein